MTPSPAKSKYGGTPVGESVSKYGGVPVDDGIGPSIPQGHQSPTLPDITNEDIKSVGRSALKLAPVAGATLATALAPEMSIPAMAGIAALGGMSGEGIRQGTLAATGSEGAPQSLGDAAINIGKAGLEQGAGELGERLIAKPLNWLLNHISPTRLYGGALKPPVNLSPEDRAGMISTGLNERIPVSQGGLDKLNNIVGSEIEPQVQKAIQIRTGQPGTQINPLDVTKPINLTRSRFAQQVNPGADVAAINASKKEFLDKHATFAPHTQVAPNPYATPGGPGGYVPTGTGTTRTKVPIPLDVAQAEKQGTYRVLAGKYGEQGSASTEAQKSLARGLRQQIATKAPEVAPLLEREGPLMELRDPLGRAINRESNTNNVGLRIPLVDSPEVKSSE